MSNLVENKRNEILYCLGLYSIIDELERWNKLLFRKSFMKFNYIINSITITTFYNRFSLHLS